MADRARTPYETVERIEAVISGKTSGFVQMRLVIYATVLALLLVFSGGFFWFSMYVLTAKAPSAFEADAIVVLTGGSGRIDAALDLLEYGEGERLLISGVNPSTTPESIRNLAGADAALFECCVDIGYEALDTHGNAVETRKWIKKYDYRRVLVVTSSYHLPRSLFELRHVDPDTIFIGYPVHLADSGKPWYEKLRYVKIVCSEYLKFIGAHIRAATGMGVQYFAQDDHANTDRRSERLS